MVSSMDDSDEELDQLFGGPDSELEKVDTLSSLKVGGGGLDPNFRA